MILQTFSILNHSGQSQTSETDGAWWGPTKMHLETEGQPTLQLQCECVRVRLQPWCKRFKKVTVSAQANNTSGLVWEFENRLFSQVDLQLHH